MSKRRLQRRAQQDAELRRIRARWKGVELLRAWSTLPLSQRELVTSELELALGQLDRRSPEAQAFVSALDALESLPSLLDFFGIHAASDDVNALLEMVDEREPGP